MADYLRGRGFQILAQISARVPSGRRQPDFELNRNGVFYGEGEWQSNYLKGFNQAIEFGDIPGSSGYFLIGYPDELRESVRQGRLTSTRPEILLKSSLFRAMFKVEGKPTSLFQGSLEKLPEWIIGSIEKNARLEHPDEFVSLMRDLVTELSAYLPESGSYPSLFEHIIAYMPTDKGELQTAKKAAAYLLLNQVVFYRILSAGRGYSKIQRDKIKSPSDLKSLYFDEVLKDDYQAVFNFDVASLFKQNSLKFILDMIKIIEKVEPENFTRDLLGNIFHRLIPQDVRKPVAAYYTNPMAARLLAALAVNDPRDKVADFACGSGTLLMAAYEAKANLLGRSFVKEDHKSFIEKDITGIDIMPFAAHLAVIQLALRNPIYWTDEVRIAIHDSTDMRPGDMVTSIDKTLSDQMHFAISAMENLNNLNRKLQKEVRFRQLE